FAFWTSYETSHPSHRSIVSLSQRGEHGHSQDLCQRSPPHRSRERSRAHTEGNSNQSEGEMKFCKDCLCYRQMKDAEHDLCTHRSAVIADHRRDVRGEEIPIAFYSCFAMRSGICHE